MTGFDSVQVIVTMEPCVGWSLNTPHAHHSHFPEIRAEGQTPLEAARNLVSKMTCALDSKGPDDWHRVDLEHAIGDVRAFLDKSSAAAKPA